MEVAGRLEELVFTLLSDEAVVGVVTVQSTEVGVDIEEVVVGVMAVLSSDLSVYGCRRTEFLEIFVAVCAEAAARLFGCERSVIVLADLGSFFSGDGGDREVNSGMVTSFLALCRICERCVTVSTVFLMVGNGPDFMGRAGHREAGFRVGLVWSRFPVCNRDGIEGFEGSSFDGSLSVHKL